MNLFHYYNLQYEHVCFMAPSFKDLHFKVTKYVSVSLMYVLTIPWVSQPIFYWSTKPLIETNQTTKQCTVAVLDWMVSFLQFVQ